MDKVNIQEDYGGVRLDEVERLGFGSSHERVKYIVNCGYVLESEDVFYIASTNLVSGSKKLINAVVKLLNLFKGEHEKQVKLLKLVNEEFDFYVFKDLFDETEGFGYKCKNKEVAKHLIKLSKTLEKQKTTKNIQDLQSLI